MSHSYATILLNALTTKCAQIRPYFGGAILRNVTFTQQSYASFIDLQDKLHQNLGRRRQLVSMGTHDLDRLTPPFRYEARPPKEIKFIPLGKKEQYNAEQLMSVYEVHVTVKRLMEFDPVAERKTFVALFAHNSGFPRLSHHLRCRRSCIVDAAYHQLGALENHSQYTECLFGCDCN